MSLQLLLAKRFYFTVNNMYLLAYNVLSTTSASSSVLVDVAQLK